MSDDDKLLLRRDKPKTDESFMGYIVRLAEKNGYESPSWIINLAGLAVRSRGWPTQYGQNVDLTGLELVLGLRKTELEKLQRQGREPSIHTYVYSLPKVCPPCLRQNNYCRKLWSLLPFTTCPIHESILIHRCPKCDRRITWARKNVSICRCGFDWRNAKPKRAKTSELKVSWRIYRSFELCTDSDPFPLKTSNPLYALTLEDFDRALLLIANYRLSLENEKPITTKTENSICHEAYSAAFEIFEDWPHRFHRFFKSLQRWGDWRDKHYKFYNRISILFEERRSLLFIVVAFESYLEKLWLTNQEFLFYSPLRRRFIHKMEACNLLGIDKKQIDALIRRGKLQVYKEESDHVGIWVDRESVNRYRIELARSIPIWRVVALHGLSADQIIDLIHYDCLRPLSWPIVDGEREYKFDVSEFNVLVEMVRSKIIKMNSPKKSRLVSARDVFNLLEYHKLSIGHFMLAILHDEVPPQDELHKIGLYGFMFREDQVMKYIHQTQRHNKFLR